MTPRSCLRWKPTGRIFKTVGIRWVPTGKIFNSSTIKVNSEPPNGLNADITNQYECEQTLDVSAGTLYLSAGTLNLSTGVFKLHNWYQEPGARDLGSTRLFRRRAKTLFERKSSKKEQKDPESANGCWDLVVEVVRCSRDGERGGKTRESRVLEIGGKHCAVHSVSNVG
uniref:Uncharacterized protein n=1 Tax=Tanacetum cinerariifolium TaxID=118510 RepID=A0A6L2L3C2_TANCI|nr:hypothetical protein [Tanacetum cinerariifolium]